MLKMEIKETIEIDNSHFIEGVKKTWSIFQKIELFKSIIDDLEQKNKFQAKSFKNQIKELL